MKHYCVTTQSMQLGGFPTQTSYSLASKTAEDAAKTALDMAEVQFPTMSIHTVMSISCDVVQSEVI